MSDELALRKDTERASHAKALIEDELLIEAFAAYEADLHQVWLQTKPDDTTIRERAWMAITVLRKVREYLPTVMSHGDLAKRELDGILGR